MFFVVRGAIASPFGALLGYIWFALFRPQEWVWIDISSLRLSLVLGGILLIRSISKGAFPNLSHPISKGIIIFLLSGLIAQTNAVDQNLAWNWLGLFARLSLVSLLLVTLVDTEKKFYFTIMVTCTSLGYFTAKAGLASFIAGGVQFYDGLAGAFVDNNGYALAAVMIIPLMMSVASCVPMEWLFNLMVKYGYYAAVPLTAFAVISTFSRGGLLALVAVIISYAVIQRMKAKLLLLILAIFLLFPFIPLPEGYLSRINTINNYEEQQETSALSRLHFWKVALDMAVDNPLGVGMFNFGARYDQYDFSDGLYGRNRVAHNSHLQVLAENGFLGLAAWIFLFIKSCSICLQIRRQAPLILENPQNVSFYTNMSVALLVSMIGFLVGGTFVSIALNDLTWFTFALVTALDRLFKVKIEQITTNALPQCEPII